VSYENSEVIPIGMRKVYRRLERWRRTRRGRTPIPKPLWVAAATVAREHGVFRTSKVLHLEFNRLKEFVQSARARNRTTPSAHFVELMTAPPAGVSECIIELEGRHGKMRIQWKGMTAADLAQLSRMIMEQT